MVAPLRYLLDAYLGIFSKQIMDGAPVDDDKVVTHHQTPGGGAWGGRGRGGVVVYAHPVI